MFMWQRLIAVILGIGLVAAALRLGEPRIEPIQSPTSESKQSGPPVALSPEPIAIADRESMRIYWIRSNGHNQATQAIPEERRIYLFRQIEVDRAIDEDGYRWAK